MNRIVAQILVVALILAGVFYLGRLSVGERIREVPVKVEIPAPPPVFLPATVDSVRLVELLAENDRLRGLLGDRDTAFIHDTVGIPAFVYRAHLDTTLPITARATVLDDDTTEQSVAGAVKIRAEYYGAPINAFRFPSISVNPFTIKLPVKERVREESFGNWLAFEFMGGAQGNSPGAGAQIQVFSVGLGAFMFAEQKPAYFVSYRIGVF